MSDEKRARLKRWLESGEAKLHPATFPQRELWEASPVPAADVSNHICTVTTIKGPVSRGYCEKALEMVVDRQEVLRLSILPGKNGPIQLVRKKCAPVLRFRELPATGSAMEEVDEMILEIIRTPFDLVSEPLYRVEVLRKAADEHVLILVIHHAIADGWTLGVFMTDLWSAYALLMLGLPGGLDPVPQTYTEWGASERALWSPQEIRLRRAFWESQLAGAERLWDAPEPSGDATERGRWVSEISGEQIGAVRALASRKGATLFSTALTAFQIVMAGATGKSDILVGSPAAHRSKRAVWETMGSFAGIVPLRTRLDRGVDFGKQLAETHEMTVESFANAMPFVELVGVLGETVTPGRNPVFDVRFALQNHPVPDVSMPGIEVDYRTRSTGTARFDLACELTEIGATMEVVWLYRKDMFSDSQMARFHLHLSTMLDEICKNSERSVENLMRLLP